MSVTAGVDEPDNGIVASLDTAGVEDADSIFITVVVALSVTNGVDETEIANAVLSVTVGVEDAEIVSVP